MQKITQNLSNMVIEKVNSAIDENPYGFSEEKVIDTLASEIDSARKYRVKDFDLLISNYTTEELNLYKTADQKNYDEKEIKRKTIVLEVARKTLGKAKELRRMRSKQTSRVDTNLLTHSPFFVGGNKDLKETAKREGHIELDKNGLRKITYRNDRGALLSSNDARTLVALFSLWEEQGFEKTLRFTEYQLIDKLNMGIGGKQYKLLRDSLEKLRTTSVILQEAYVLSEGKRTVTESFPLIIANRFIVDEDKTGRTHSKEYNIEFSPYISKSFNDGYCTLISLAIFDELETEISQQVYLLISGFQDMENNEKYKLPDGSFEIPLKTMYESLFLGDINRKNKATLDKGCEELKNADIIQDYYFKKTKNKYTDIVISPSEWLIDVLTNRNQMRPLEDKSKQLAFKYDQ